MQLRIVVEVRGEASISEDHHLPKTIAVFWILTILRGPCASPYHRLTEGRFKGLLSFGDKTGPKDHINMRILHSVSSAQDEADSRDHGL